MGRWFSISALMLLLMPVSLYANGDPVAQHCALTLSKAPVARQIPEIQIEKENLDIHLDDGFSRITVDYVLHNMTGKRFRNIQYGFPVDWEGDGPAHWEGDGWTESLYEKGWSDDYVTDFSFRLGSEQLVAKCSADTLIKPAFTAGDWHRINGYPNWKEESLNFESVLYSEILCEYEWEGTVEDSLILDYPVYRRWYYTVFTVKPHETVTLHVEYTLKHQYKRRYYVEECEFVKGFSIWDGKEVWSGAYNHFIYDYSPAAAWGDGTTKEMNLTVHYPDSTTVRNYSDFDYASEEPLKLGYSTRINISHDVESVKKHRLAPSRYRIVQGENDERSYKELSDLDGRTGLLLEPSDSGDYKLSIILDSCIKVTGLVIMNGDCRDSLSWVSNGRAEKMMVSRLVRGGYYQKVRWTFDYAETVWTRKYVEGEHYPAPCRQNAPEDYSWDGLICSAEKINMGRRIWPDGWYVDDSPTFTDQIVIYIPKQEKGVYLSEIIVLYEDPSHTE